MIIGNDLERPTPDQIVAQAGKPSNPGPYSRGRSKNIKKRDLL